MNDDHLKTYVNDHLALLVGETELAGRCHRSNKEGNLGRFLHDLSADLQAEQDLLKQILERIGGSPSVVKQSAAWLAEKAGRFKLNDALLEYSDLSRLVELETLFVAAQGRRSFWENLEAARGPEPRLSQISITSQQQQAQRHAEALAKHRLDAARKAI
jgi:hypothetical protein